MWRCKEYPYGCRAACACAGAAYDVAEREGFSCSVRLLL